MEKKFYEQPLVEVMDVEEDANILLETSNEQPGFGGEIDGEGPEE